MKISAIYPTERPGKLKRCHQCDFLYRPTALANNQDAYCPRCQAKVASGKDWSLSRLTVIALLCLLLMPFAWSLPLIEIRLLNMPITANVVEGIRQMVKQNDIITAAMVAFCVIAAPLTLVLSILGLSLGEKLSFNVRPILLLLERLKEWVMLDIYLIGIGVAAIKVQETADLYPSYGLVAFISLTLLSLVLLSHLNVEHLWDRFYPQNDEDGEISAEECRVCVYCHQSGKADDKGRCPRCHLPLTYRLPYSLQKSWAALIASVMFLLPANLLPISVIYLSGSRQEDTIFSGIISLASGNIPIAMVVFVASILVPLSKVIILIALLLSIHFNCQQGIHTRIKLLRIIKWVGRWSMLDLFVISLTMSLIDRDQLLAFTMGDAAVYFGAAVILTILAVEWLDSRLLWDAHATGQATDSD